MLTVLNIKNSNTHIYIAQSFYSTKWDQNISIRTSTWLAVYIRCYPIHIFGKLAAPARGSGSGGGGGHFAPAPPPGSPDLNAKLPLKALKLYICE